MQHQPELNNIPAQLTIDHVSSATLFLEKQRQMQEVQMALDAQKDEYARKVPNSIASSNRD
ncbi:hypothetical protein BVRB_026000 [Beta vulgaris subsp. vulgaris]|uniref:Uncharacterized protein n=1 Tax=Beta vulgaris subsp. vulgaris TaxID=3555 RepID=A0A0J8DT84_BETVV|nr:hypothetical protein BVRB_026000 [Beta vulgaris subsp. vulgaris]